MLSTRIKTAFLLLIPVVLALVLRGVALDLLLVIVFVAINYEILSFTPQIRESERLVLLTLLCALPGGLFLWGASGAAGAFLLGLICALSLAVIWTEREVHEHDRIACLAIIGLSFAYTGVFGVSLIACVRGVPAGYLWWLLATVISADTGAYFSGRAFGTRLLAPRVSPKKTVAGAIGGITSAALVSLGIAHLLHFPEHPFQVAAWGVIVGVLAMFGDLVESLLKRAFDKKDSGTLLPGHGGMLDRVDALLFAAPVLYFFGV